MKKEGTAGYITDPEPDPHEALKCTNNSGVHRLSVKTLLVKTSFDFQFRDISDNSQLPILTDKSVIMKGRGAGFAHCPKQAGVAVAAGHPGYVSLK